jgi:CBS domain-containing protein
MPKPERSRTKPPAARWTAAGRARPPTARSFVINVTVRDVMSRHPISVGPDATLLDALVLMRGQKVSGLPVVNEDGKLVGVLSQRDVARALKTAGGIPEVTGLFDLLMFGLSEESGVSVQVLRRILEETTVRDAMSSPPIAIPSDASLELAAEVMRENEINRIPVLRGDRLVGIVTRNDLVRALVHS